MALAAKDKPNPDTADSPSALLYSKNDFVYGIVHPSIWDAEEKPPFIIFGWMGEAAATDGAAAAKPQGKRAFAIAKQLITHWALYHKVAFEGMVILVWENEVTSFLKVKVCNPQPALLASVASIGGIVVGEKYGGEKGDAKLEVW